MKNRIIYSVRLSLAASIMLFISVLSNAAIVVTDNTYYEYEDYYNVWQEEYYTYAYPGNVGVLNDTTFVVGSSNGQDYFDFQYDGDAERYSTSFTYGSVDVEITDASAQVYLSGSIWRDKAFRTGTVRVYELTGNGQEQIYYFGHTGAGTADFLYEDLLGPGNYRFEFRAGLGPFFNNIHRGSWNYNMSLREVAVVPVPAAAWLFGSALIGLAGIKRKQ